MKGMTCSIYENKSFGNCSNGGLSSPAEVTRVTLCGEGIPELSKPTTRAPAVVLDKRRGDDENWYRIIPVVGVREGYVGWMFGGCFVYSSDSRFPSRRPIPLHDRQDSYDDYRLLTT